MVSVKRRETWSCRLEKKSIRLLLSFWIVWWLISLQHRYEKKVGGKWYRDDISLKYQNLQAYVITAQMQTTRTQADSAVSCYILHTFLGSNRKVDNTTAHFSKTLNPFSLHDRTTEMKHNPDVQRIKWCQVSTFMLLGFPVNVLTLKMKNSHSNPSKILLYLWVFSQYCLSYALYFYSIS